MNSTTLFLLAIAIVVAGGLGLSFGHFWRRMQSGSRVAIPPHSDLLSLAPAQEGFGLALVDERGMKLLEAVEIDRIPTRAHKLDTSADSVGRVTHLAADLVKGAISIPGKTVSVVFNPEIQKGLSEGTYTLMKTKSGEVLADAIDVSSKEIVGKGRLVQGSTARQLATGAFQLVSIAVAQSHLADIERSLGAINEAVAEVLAKLENADRGQISGALEYLNGIASHMRNGRSADELSLQKRNAIEITIRDSFVWRNKLRDDIKLAMGQVAGLKDQETFGTGDTHKRLKQLAEQIDPLLKRYALLLHFSLAASYVTAYLDPGQTQYSRMDPDIEGFAKLFREFHDTSVAKAKELISKSIVNSDELLQLRRQEIETRTSKSVDLALQDQSEHLRSMRALDLNLRNLIDVEGRVHVAITFDERCEVRAAAFV